MMTRDLLDAAVGTPPPSTIDVHRLVHHERRSRVVRGTGIGAAALAALALGGFLIGQPDHPDPAPPRAQPAEQPPADSRFQLLANDKESADATAQRLGDALTTSVVQASPSTAWVPDQPGTAGAARVLAEFSQDDKIMPYFFSGGGLLVTDKHHGVLNLLVVRELKAGETYGKKLGSIPLKCGAEPGCTQSAGPHGEQLFTRSTGAGPAGGARIDVRLALPGGRILMLNTEAMNADLDTANAVVPPMTAAQLRAVAVDIAGQTRD